MFSEMKKAIGDYIDKFDKYDLSAKYDIYDVAKIAMKYGDVKYYDFEPKIKKNYSEFHSVPVRDERIQDSDVRTSDEDQRQKAFERLRNCC